MSVTVDQKKANSILLNAFNQVKHCYRESNQFPLIPIVVNGHHKTYRYLLLTGILAKATNTNCNPIVLQANAGFTGSYDARSLCHKVVVPFERSYLSGKLGSSNEPFLNKPARTTHLSIKNPVKGAKDRKILEATIDILSSLNDSDAAFIALKDCLYHIELRDDASFLARTKFVAMESPQNKIIDFANLFLSESREGETSALITGVIYEIVGLISGKDLDVRVHKVNQAGSSSKEVLDVDIYYENYLINSVEVKDKEFSPEDVEHAVVKGMGAGLKSITFVCGKKGSLNSGSEFLVKNIWCDRGFDIFFVNIVDHLTSILSLAPSVTAEQFLNFLDKHVQNAKIKDETYLHLVNCTDITFGKMTKPHL